MSQQNNIAATQRLGEAVNSGKLEVLREVFAANAIDRQQFQIQNEFTPFQPINAPQRGLI